jgi:hypothetical protein
MRKKPKRWMLLKLRQTGVQILDLLKVMPLAVLGVPAGALGRVLAEALKGA